MGCSGDEGGGVRAPEATRCSPRTIRCKAICFLLWYGFAYFIGVVVVGVYILLIMYIRYHEHHVDIGVWLVLWFLVCQAWAVALAWFIAGWMAQRRRWRRSVAPKPGRGKRASNAPSN